MTYISQCEPSLNINGAIASALNWAQNLYPAVKFIRYIVFAVKINAISPWAKMAMKAAHGFIFGMEDVQIQKFEWLLD